MDLEERYDNFLSDLTELSKRHALTIGGCGCCGSPHFTEIGDGKYDDRVEGEYRHYSGERIHWVNKEK